MTVALLIALVFGIAGFLILWFTTALRVQLLGAALLTAAFVVFLSILVGRAGTERIGSLDSADPHAQLDPSGQTRGEQT
jgi:membrane protein implicated in regulation of membrane protease activity